MAPSLIGYFARHTRDVNTALELMAVTIARAFEARQEFNGSSDEQAAAWLWKIARRELARFHESRSVERSALARLGWELPDATERDIREVEQMIAAEDVGRQLQAALDTLPADQREVIELRYVEDLSDPDVHQQAGDLRAVAGSVEGADFDAADPHGGDRLFCRPVQLQGVRA
jgi:RNA polymerase sigma-70 factor (ECF subfamily)